MIWRTLAKHVTTGLIGKGTRDNDRVSDCLSKIRQKLNINFSDLLLMQLGVFTADVNYNITKSVHP